MVKILTLLVICCSSSAFAVQLVSDQTIQTQKQLTTYHKLKNGIVVLLREEPNSDIVYASVNFSTGTRDVPGDQKVVPRLLFQTMPMAAAGYPKEKVFSTVEKYALELGCNAGIERSFCAMGTINDYWDKALPLLAAVVKGPTLSPEDVKVQKGRLEADLKQATQDPSGYVNDIS